MTAEDPRLASARALVTRITALVHELDETLNATAAPTPETPQPPKRPGPDNTGVLNTGGWPFSKSGSLTITEDGAVLAGADITGSVTIKANNVTIVDCRIRAKTDAGTSAYPIKVASSDVTGLVIEDCEIDGNGRTSLCVGTKNYTLRRCNVHGAAGDLLRADGNVLVEDSWLHGIVRQPGGHHDAVQMLKGTDVTLRRNTIDIVINDPVPGVNLLGLPMTVSAPDPLNACFIISAGAPVDRVTLEGNWLNGGNYSLYLGANDKGIAVTNVVARGNVFAGWRYGPTTARGTALLEGNVDPTGKTI